MCGERVVHEWTVHAYAIFFDNMFVSSSISHLKAAVARFPVLRRGAVRVGCCCLCTRFRKKTINMANDDFMKHATRTGRRNRLASRQINGLRDRDHDRCCVIAAGTDSGAAKASGIVVLQNTHEKPAQKRTIHGNHALKAVCRVISLLQIHQTSDVARMPDSPVGATGFEVGVATGAVIYNV